MSTQADVCLVLEGTYPYIVGGVSNWAHDLINTQSHLTFSLVCILPPNFNGKAKYALPKNVVEVSHIVLQQLPKGTSRLPKPIKTKLFQSIELPLLHLQYAANLKILKQLLDALNAPAKPLGSNILLNSEDAWHMLLRMYRSSMGEGSFLNFYWSCRGLLAGMYSILLAKIPEAKVYHTLCTGYAGLFTARAHQETNRPCIVTEHGIYTNERRIEIAAAEWLSDSKAMNLNIIRPNYERELKDYWIDTFSGYSKLCYDSCSEIFTLYEGNKDLQVTDGADPCKIRIVSNGIDFERFSSITKVEKKHPTIALIGRVVPIKDIKTFIRAVAILKEQIPDLRAYVIGSIDEDEEYYAECVEVVQKYYLADTLTFTGKMQVENGLKEIDVLVLTSISEAQPLVVLEGGAAGIPCVTTDVGSCSELVFGRSDENPKLGQAGEICPLSNPQAIAAGVYRLLSDKSFYQECSRTIKKRVEAYYLEKDQAASYKQIYERWLEE